MALTVTKPEVVEDVEVDINDTSLAEGVESELDAKEDWQAKAAPPPKGRYKLRLFLDDEKLQQATKQGFKQEDPAGKYYKKQITCKIQDTTGKWQDSVVYYNVSTGIPKGKKISSMAGLLSLLKVTIPAKATDKKIAQLLFKAFEKIPEPLLIGDCDWQCWDQTAKARGRDLGSVAIINETKKAANTMVNFPKLADGSAYNHIVHNKEGIELYAKLKVVKLYAPAKVQAAAATLPQAATAPVAQPKPPAQAAPAPAQAPPAPAADMQVDETSVAFADDGEVILEL